MPYQYVREPLTAEVADRLANACETPTEQLIVWTLLDTGLRVGELCDLTSKDVLWQQRQLRVRGKGGPYCKRSKVRVVPMSRRVRALLEHHFALRKEFPVRPRRAQGLVKEVANRAGLTKDVTPHVLRHTFAATALQKGISLATVQKILGHDRLQTTAIYLNFTDTHKFRRGCRRLQATGESPPPNVENNERWFQSGTIPGTIEPWPKTFPARGAPVSRATTKHAVRAPRANPPPQGKGRARERPQGGSPRSGKGRSQSASGRGNDIGTPVSEYCDKLPA